MEDLTADKRLTGRKAAFCAIVTATVGYIAGVVLSLLVVAHGALGQAAVSCPGSDPVPSQAAAKGYTSETFCDGPWALSEIDVNDTKVPGFKWYVEGRWPYAQTWNALGWDAPGDFATATGTCGNSPTSTTCLNFRATATTITNVSGGFGQIMTCYPTTASPWIAGQTFTGGFYLESNQLWTGPQYGGGEGSWPIIWTWPANNLVAKAPGNTLGEYVELDNFEACCGRNLNLWSSSNNNSPIGNSTPHTTMNQAGAKYGVLLWNNGGTWQLDWYLNDAFDQTAAPISGYPETLSTLAGQQNCLLLGTSSQTNHYNSFVRMWQTLQAPPAVGGGRWRR